MWKNEHIPELCEADAANLLTETVRRIWHFQFQQSKAERTIVTVLLVSWIEHACYLLTQGAYISWLQLFD